MKKSDAIVALARIGSDTLMSLTAFTAAYYLRMQWYEIPLFGGLETLTLFPSPTTMFPFPLYWGFALNFTLLLIIVMAIQGRYRLGTDEKWFDELHHTFWGVAASMALLLGYFFFAQEYFFSRLIFGLAWVLTLVLLWSGRGLIRSLAHVAQLHGWGVQRVLVLGTGELAKRILEGLAKDPKLKAVGVLSEKPSKTKTLQNISIWGDFKALGTLLKKKSVDEVWLATEDASSKLTAKLVAQAHINHAKFKFFPDELGLDLAAVRVSTFRNLPIITLLNSPLYGWWALVKTMIDFVVALLALVILSPLLFVVAIVVWLSDRSAPIFYSSDRVGANGQTFTCHKFRTMVVGAEAQKKKLMKSNQRGGGVLFKIDKDPRITPLGHWLRKYSVDELPQLLNVFKGEMSLIGPRPHLVDEVKKYPAHNRQLLSLRPGLTGFAQINGRSNLSFEDEMKHEMFYLKNWSLWLDWVIFVKTIWVVIRGDNK